MLTLLFTFFSITASAASFGIQACNDKQGHDLTEASPPLKMAKMHLAALNQDYENVEKKLTTLKTRCAAYGANTKQTGPDWSNLETSLSEAGHGNGNVRSQSVPIMDELNQIKGHFCLMGIDPCCTDLKKILTAVPEQISDQTGRIRTACAALNAGH